MSAWELTDVSNNQSLSLAQTGSYDRLVNSHDRDSLNDVESIHSGAPDNTTSQGTISSPPTSSSIKKEDAGSNHIKIQNARFYNIFGDWWWEIGAALFSLACVASIVAILSTVQDKARSEWKFLILPNSLVAVFSTLSKASLMVPVASCISQLKWIHFTHAPHALSHAQVFDEASRGPWGALTLLCTIRAQKWLATLGAVITIVAIAVEPFIQAIITYPQREVRLSGQASFGTAYVYGPSHSAYLKYDKGGSSSTSFCTIYVYLLIIVTVSKYMMNSKMQGAVLNGIYNLNSPVQFQCSTGNCFWPAFTTIGACYQCRAVSTTEIEFGCGYVPTTSSSSESESAECEWTTPGGIVLTQKNTTRLASSSLQVNASTVQKDSSYGLYQTPNALLALIAVVNISDFQLTEPEEQRYMECSLNLCAKTFQSAKITNGTFSPGPITETYLDAGRPGNSEKEKLFGLDEMSSSLSVPAPGQGTIAVDMDDFDLLSKYIVEVFSSPADTDFGTVVRSSPNITETIANISTSITYAFGTSEYANQTHGFALTTEQYIHVRWAWLALPIAVVLMGCALLALTIVQTMRMGVTSWKSSSILPLFTQFDGWGKDDLHVATGPVKGLEQKAKGMRGTIELDKDAGRVLFVNASYDAARIHNF